MGEKAGSERMQMAATAGKVERVLAWKDGAALSPPQKMFLAPAAGCNLRCRYCVHSLSQYRKENYRKEADDASFLRVVEEALEMGVPLFNIGSTSEPLLRRELTFRMMKLIKEGGAEGAITTNATLLDGGILTWMVEAGWDNVAISLDSHEERTADRLRGSGTYRHCVSCLEQLRRLKGEYGTSHPVVTLNVVLTSYNYTHLPETIRFARAHGVSELNVIPVTVYDDAMSGFKLSDSQARQFQQVLRESIPLVERMGFSQTNLPSLLDERLVSRTGDMRAVLTSGFRGGGAPLSPCFEPWTTLVMHADGSINPCQHNSKMNRLGERRLADAWREDAFLESMRGHLVAGTLPAFCEGCCSAIVAEHLSDQRNARLLLSSR